MKFYCDNLADTEKLAEKFGELIVQNGCFISLYGEIGAGKTAFAKFLLKKIGVKQAVTSPSFVILNEYHAGADEIQHLPVYHFDLYRLEDEGVKTILSELVEYSREKVITLVEWADFGQGELPVERVNITVSYGEGEVERIFEFTGIGKKYEEIVEVLEHALRCKG